MSAGQSDAELGDLNLRVKSPRANDLASRFGDMRGLQPSDYRLFVTVCHRNTPTANRAR
jgi:hypothetical protein